MLLSLLFLSMMINSIQSFNQQTPEEPQSGWAGFVQGLSYSFLIFLLICAIILVIMEFIVLIYLFYTVLKCIPSGPERLLHITLVVFFTYPYGLLTAFFPKNCTKDIFAKKSPSIKM